MLSKRRKAVKKKSKEVRELEESEPRRVRTGLRGVYHLPPPLLQVQKMLDSKPYAVDNCKILQDMLFGTHELCQEYNSENCSSKKARLIKELLNFPPDSPPYLEAPVYFDYGVHTTVGKNFFCNFNCVFLDCAKISIGDNVFLAPNVQLYTAAHPLDHKERRETEFARPITIGDDVWIGGGSIVLPGVEIGSRVVVAAGSVVTKNVPSDCVVAGVPARVLPTLSPPSAVSRVSH
jgi:maltose O-acetyltransferase